MTHSYFDKPRIKKWYDRF